MAEQKQNGGTMVDDTASQTPGFKEGELILFVRLVKASREFQCIFRDLDEAILLHKLSGEYIDLQVQGMFRPQPQIAVPSLPTFDSLRQRRLNGK